MIERVLTIGAFGFDQESFLRTLKEAGADILIDIRARRGVRGAEYAFVNSKRLQKSLAEAGIDYVHAVELSPPAELRAAQERADKEAGIAKRKRVRLGHAFIDGYEKTRMTDFDAAGFAERAVNGRRRPVFFCVEREPEACHRSIVAKRFAAAMKTSVQDLRPAV